MTQSSGNAVAFLRWRVRIQAEIPLCTDPPHLYPWRNMHILIRFVCFPRIARRSTYCQKFDRVNVA